MQQSITITPPPSKPIGDQARERRAACIASAQFPQGARVVMNYYGEHKTGTVTEIGIGWANGYVPSYSIRFDDGIAIGFVCEYEMTAITAEMQEA